MRSVRSLLVVTGTLVGLGVLAPSVSAALDTPQPIVITKECSQFTGNIPSFCTITSSTLPAIPAGSKVFYYGPEINDPDYTSSWVILNAGHGNRATGYCSLLGNDGNCSFFEGTGTLAGFHAAVQVTLPGDEFLWEGTYRFDRRH